MDDSTRLISQNLKNIREEKRISLDKLAELTGQGLKHALRKCRKKMSSLSGDWID